MLQKFRNYLFSSRDRMLAYFIISFFVLVTIFWYFMLRPIDNLGEFLVLIFINVIISSVFGVAMTDKLQENSGYLFSMNTKELAYQQEFQRMLKNEEIPTPKAARTRFIERLEQVETSNRQALKQPVFLAIIYLYSLYVTVFGEGFHILRITAIFLVMALTISFISIKRNLRKIERIKKKQRYS